MKPTIEDLRQRLADDWPYYARNCLKIVDKAVSSGNIDDAVAFIDRLFDKTPGGSPEEVRREQAIGRDHGVNAR